MGPTKFLSGFLIVLSLASSIVGVDRTFENYLNRRQITNCLAPCGPILPAIECPDSSCACTTFNSAGSTALSQCQACIVGAASQYGPIFHVAVDTCSKCQSQCSSIIGVFLRSLSGGATSCDLQCLCAAYASVSPSDVSACTNCLQTVNQSDVTVISQLEQQCQNFTSSTGTVSQSQAPIASFEGHFSYDVKPRYWISLDANFWYGGRTSLNGVENPATLQENSRIGVTASIPLSKHQSVKASYSRGAYGTFGGNFQNVSVAWQYSWLGRPN